MEILGFARGAASVFLARGKLPGTGPSESPITNRSCQASDEIAVWHKSDRTRRLS